MIAKIVYQRVSRLCRDGTYTKCLHMLLYIYYFLTLHSALYFFAFSFGNHSLPLLQRWIVTVSNKKQSKYKISEAYRSGQTALGRSPWQGGAATHTQVVFPAGQPDRTWHVVVSGRSRDTDRHVANPVARSHSLIYCKLTSPDAIFIQGTVNHHNFILKWMVREKE